MPAAVLYANLPAYLAVVMWWQAALALTPRSR